MDIRILTAAVLAFIALDLAAQAASPNLRPDTVFADSPDATPIVTCSLEESWSFFGLNRQQTEPTPGTQKIEAEPHDALVDRFLPRSPLPLPMFQSLTEGLDVTMPLPVGASFLWTEIDRHVAVSDVRLALGGGTPTSVERVNVPTTTFHSTPKLARIDAWVLPFMNVYGIVGHTETQGDVRVTINRFPLPGSPPIELIVPADLQGTTAGFGATTGIGTKKWFAMVDVNNTWTSFDKLDSALTALVVAPRVGLVIDQSFFKGEVHVGAMWQDTDQTVELTIDHPLLGNGLHVEVDQYEPNPWNFLVGGMWAIDERLQLTVEGGMGGRSYIVSGITVRF
ncbi:hypothetical protein Pan44_10930 [Caulifigura coniformis]|uniref:Transporter n=1 Tax=Caulifigura coniformis TaxID=2527983 RepID=A0A517SAD1_9PLAN|nr:hypothetical protein [Caulifigura coniformis]QDT53078.1 hypothetical protein Pan44_10930 [Caulifigura coniformis]